MATAFRNSPPGNPSGWGALGNQIMPKKSYGSGIYPCIPAEENTQAAGTRWRTL